MWFDGVRQPNTIYVANSSRGKDSTAMLRAIQLMGWPLDYVISTDIWFDDETPAELPPMVAFKDEWDRKCLENFGVPVTRLCAMTTPDKKNYPPWMAERERERESSQVRLTADVGSVTQITSTSGSRKENTPETSRGSPQQRPDGADISNTKSEKMTYCDIFYRKVGAKALENRKQGREREREHIPEIQRRFAKRHPELMATHGFPNVRNRWCTGELKDDARKDLNEAFTKNKQSTTLWIPEPQCEVAQQRTQSKSARQPEVAPPRAQNDYYGFPARKGAWCNKYIKTDVARDEQLYHSGFRTNGRTSATARSRGMSCQKGTSSTQQSLFRQALWNEGRENKYRSLCRYCRR